MQKKISKLEVANFFRQFATLMQAGLPLLLSYDILATNFSASPLKTIIDNVRQQAELGHSIQQSFQPHLKIFGQLTGHLLAIGEKSGTLITVLELLADANEKKVARQKRIQQALFYPTIIIITGFLVVIALVCFVIPQFIILFESKDKLPWLTQCIFNLATTLPQHYLLLAIMICAGIFFIYHKHGIIIKIAHPILLHFDFYKNFRNEILYARFIRHLAITLSAGMPILPALKLLSTDSRDHELNKLLASLSERLNQGLSLHAAMEATANFPIVLLNMIKVGESSGSLETMLCRLATFHEQRIEQSLDKFTQLLEPLIMILLGVVIGGLVIGLYLPIFKLGTLL